ncbi:MAG: pyrroloquinoline quinone precursor peptide PqqA [Zoogloeaceae bacterium]|nr:pyrroloquinoline quinone precursor peptide PqqA [Zoogloeaceae bacterium]
MSGAGAIPAPNPDPNLIRRITMQWETPNAIDFRFGFEITMYIATR